MAKKEQTLQEKAHSWIDDRIGPCFDKEGITPEQFAEDKSLALKACRKELTKKRKSKQLFTAIREMRQEYDQVITVRGWKAPERKQLSGALTIEQIVKEIEEEDG